jgi:uncharacterized protein (TIRG00374 family)
LHIALLPLGGLGAIFVTLASANLFWLLPAFGLFAIAYILRAVRWWALLRPFQTKGNPASLFPMLVGGIFLTYVVPLRAGDIATPYWLREKTGTRFTAGLASILLARFLDFASLALIIVISAFLLFGAVTGEAFSSLIGGVVLVAVFIVFFFLIRNEKFVTWFSGILGRLFKPSKTLKDEVPAFVENFAEDMRKDIGSWNSGIALLLSVPLWVIETLKIAFLALAFGQVVSLLDSIFISALSYTGGHLLGFLLPAGIGIFVLQIVGISEFLQTIPGLAHVVSIALLDGLIYIIGLSVLGVPSLATMGRGYQHLQDSEETPSQDERSPPSDAG